METVSRKDAKALGVKRYFTGKPCKFGHVAERYAATGQCITCIRSHNARWQKENPERYRQARDRWALENAEHFVDLQRQWTRQNPDRVRAKHKRYLASNPGVIAANAARRRASMSQSAPKWANKNLMKQYYNLSRAMSELTGIDFNVDHTVPLQCETVCGLHAHTNLTILPAFLNRSKSNRYWPDMPE